MSFTMPDIRNLSEADAQAALIAAGVPGTVLVDLWPSVIAGDYDDADFLGTEQFQGRYADSVGLDGSVSWQRPVPGAVVDTDVDEVTINWTDPATSVPRAGAFGFNIWGVSGGDLPGDQLETTIGVWAQTPGTTAFQASEEIVTGPWTEADFAAGSSFRVELTTLHRPSGAAEVLTVAYDAEDPLHQPYAGQVVSGELVAVTQFADISVKETLNDQTELSFTMSLFDPLAQHVINPPTYLPDVPADYEGNGAYTFACRVYYRNQIQPCFWAPCTFGPIDFAAGTVTVTGIDVIRPQHHYLRVGDPILDQESDNGLVDTGFATIDYVGILNTLVAADNTDEQDARDVPSLGYEYSHAASTPRTARIGVERSEGVWDVIQRITGHALGPDWWLEPRNDEPGRYARVRMFDKRGSDRTATVRWYYGVGPADNPDEIDNVSAVTATPMIPVTHAHVVASDQTEIRETVGDALESYMRGIFVNWTAQDGNTKNKAEAVVRAGLHSVAGAQVDAYANSPEQIDITLRPDAAQDAFWREQFWPGDTVYFHAAKGYGEAQGNLRIRSVEVGEQGWRGPTTTKVTVVPDKTSDVAGGEA